MHFFGPLLLNLAVIFLVSSYCTQSQAYASFIGFGYTNCTTCHYNPHGNGQLTDYGRALFASEIAAKPFWRPNANDEDLANHSSFTFRQPGPGGFKPALKYREIYVNSSPGGTSATRKIVMQADMGLSYIFDEAEQYILVLSAGYTATPINSDIKPGANNYNLLSREHYLRMQLAEGQFLSVGLMDIVYGIRLVDHTSYSRSGIGLDYNDQVHGVLYDYFKGKWMIGVHGFVGNQMRDQVDRISGLSTTLEYEVKEKLLVGMSALSGSTQAFKKTLLGFHTRVGIGKGSSVLGEIGINKTEPVSGTATTGNYGVLSGTIRLVRGLDFESVVEMLKPDMSDSDEKYRWTVGFIYFPFQRVELRLNAVDARQLSPSQVKGDLWYIQSQLHLSL